MLYRPPFWDERTGSQRWPSKGAGELPSEEKPSGPLSGPSYEGSVEGRQEAELLSGCGLNSLN